MTRRERMELPMTQRFKQFCLDWPVFVGWSVFCFGSGIIAAILDHVL